MVTALVLLGVTATFAGSLFIPVDIELDAQAGDGNWARVRVEWLYGRLSREFATYDPKRPARERDDEEPSDPLKTLRNGRSVWESELRDRLQALLQDLARRLTIDDMSVHGRVGLGDPAGTGMAMAALLPLADFANQLSRCEVDIEPCYEQAELVGDAHARVRVVPMELLRPVLAFGLSPANVREMHALWKNRER